MAKQALHSNKKLAHRAQVGQAKWAGFKWAEAQVSLGSYGRPSTPKP